MSTRVKICGITRVEDARATAQAGASAIGLVFWPGSPRCVTPRRGAEIAAVAAQAGMSVVGVFVDQPPSVVQDTVRSARLDGIQLHGREEIAAYTFGVPIIKALGVGSGWHAGLAAAWPASVLLMLDARDDQRMGGTGKAIDWRLAGAVARTRRIVLAGGLTPENVGRAIAMASPYAVDVSSGVESRPGIKDAAKVRAFVAAVTAADGAVPRGLFA
jgi:phosphoribosylanthranilate isomerase